MPARRVFLVALIIVSLCCVGYAPPMLTDSDIPERVLTGEQLRAWHGTECPQVSAASAIVVSNTTGEILCAKNEHERRAPASFAKIVTALVALQHTRQDERVTINAWDLSVSSMTGLRHGKELSMRELLLALLVPSDNAAAKAIARHAAGDVTTFVGWMNEFVASLGLRDTHFANPHGLDNPEGYTSAYDVAIMARYAMQDPTFADIVGRPAVIIGEYLWPSSNLLFDQYPGVKGIKTGTTDEAGECFVGLVDRAQGSVLVVVMGSQDRWADTTLLLNYYYARYAELCIDLPENRQNRYFDAEGVAHTLYLRDPFSMLVAPADVNTASLYRRIDNPAVNPGPDEPVGVLVVTLNGQHLAARLSEFCPPQSPLLRRS